MMMAGGNIKPAESITVKEIERTVPKHTLKSNYQVVYNQLPGKVDRFSEIFSKGMFYGRLRSNTFYFKWEAETPKQNSHLVSGLGGSLVFKSANFANFDFTLAGYYSRGFFDEDSDPVNRLKAGKDVLSRFDYTNTGSKNLAVLGQAYLRYTGIEKTNIKIGRQIVESFFAKSNDTKMIPNTFDGVVMDTKVLPDTKIRLGYLYEQKLRDHSTAHSVLAVGDANSTTSDNPQWSENDDTAMHKGLTYSRLKAAGVDPDAPLILGDIQNKSIANLKLNASFYAVPDLLSSVMTEANYKIQLDGFSITPGVRYIKQFDNGAGEIGGAAYRGQLAGHTGAYQGYKDASSLESQMIAARIVTKIDNYKVNLGYSYVLDEADLITPWRAFPTSGYTRSMARYNWMANTKSYRLEVVRNGNSKGIYNNLYTQMSVLYTDADESKGYFDEMYYYAGFVKNFPSLDSMQVRFRIGYQDTEKVDADGLDTRFEVNYQF
ncbi:outer membrane porin, OprD family [Sulfurovum indicum]|uniref:Outer membrane porin, OprD family n=2 Tax=Sulfurovaceae TaxID=2771472 RepID=A0A7M1S9K6_9BACT|nr:outer membrane porin, OprD family [Sulfurovum indicum]